MFGYLFYDQRRTRNPFHHSMADASKYHFLKAVQSPAADHDKADSLFIGILDDFRARRSLQNRCFGLNASVLNQFSIGANLLRRSSSRLSAEPACNLPSMKPEETSPACLCQEAYELK